MNEFFDDFKREHERLRQALINLDMEFARSELPECSSDLSRLAAMHKARYEFTTISAELRHESRAWLEKFGFHRYKNLPWPPEGMLEE